MANKRRFTSLLGLLPPPFGSIANIVSAFSSEDGQNAAEDILRSTAGRYFGTNLTGAEMAANQFNAEEAQKQRDFEERMSSTTYQRTVQDMRQAGLNPALLLTGASGVSTPSGSTATSVSPSSGASLTDLMLLPFQIANLNAQTNKTNVEAHSEIPAKVQNLLASSNQYMSNARNLELDSEQKEIVLKYLDEQQRFYTAGLGLSNEQIQQDINESVARVANLDEQNKKILQEIVESQQRVSTLLSQEHLNEAEVEEVYKSVKLIEQQTKLLTEQTKLTEKDVKWYTANHISGMVGDVGNAVGSVASGLGKAASNLFSRRKPVGFNTR